MGASFSLFTHPHCADLKIICVFSTALQLKSLIMLLFDASEIRER